MKFKKNEDQSVDTVLLLRIGKKNTHGRSYRDKVWSCVERMDHLETAIPGDPSHNQPPNDDTIAHPSKRWLKGP